VLKLDNMQTCSLTEVRIENNRQNLIAYIRRPSGVVWFRVSLYQALRLRLRRSVVMINWIVLDITSVAPPCILHTKAL